MRRALHILLVALVLTSCGARVIPRDTMASIYAEMFLVDQWLKNDRPLSRKADTSFVYEPILEKYGYTSADYRKSVVRYMDDPERFSRILEKTEDILNKHIELLKLTDKLEARLDSIRTAKKNRWFPKVRAPLLPESPYLSDSLAYEIDSTGMVHIAFATADTMFRGPAMVIRDSILRRDSITCAIRDSLIAAKVDSASLQSILDSLVNLIYAVPVDSLALADSLASKADSVLAKVDSVAVRIDSVAAKADSVKPRVVEKALLDKKL